MTAAGIVCKKHPRYAAKREPTVNCRACWRMFVRAEAGRQLAAAHRAATGKMVVIDTQAQNLENSPEKISASSVVDILHIIDQRLSYLDQGAAQLWAILTSLRANNDEQVGKTEVTVPLRGIAFPITAGRAFVGGRLADFSRVPDAATAIEMALAYLTESRKNDQRMFSSTIHWVYHAEDALFALKDLRKVE